LKPNGACLIVEYNVDSGNPWAPYPLSFETFRALAPHVDLTTPRLLATVPSRFLREFYSAAAYKRAGDASVEDWRSTTIGSDAQRDQSRGAG
jgi:hypothetical protein